MRLTKIILVQLARLLRSSHRMPLPYARNIQRPGWQRSHRRPASLPVDSPRSPSLPLASLALLIMIVLLIAAALPARAATPPSATYLPLVAKAGAAQPYADAYSVPLPFTVLDSVQPAPVEHGGWWYFVAYRVDSGDRNGGWVLRWRPDAQAAEAVEQLSYEDAQGAPRGVEPVGQYSPSRGSLAQIGGALYHWSFPSGSGRATRLEIKVVAR